MTDAPAGRVDAASCVGDNQTLPGTSYVWANITALFTGSFGMTANEIVAIMGIHTIGKAKADISGHEGRWTMNPYVFDNTYYKELLLGDKSKYLKTASDIELVKNPAFRPHVEQFAED